MPFEIMDLFTLIQIATTVGIVATIYKLTKKPSSKKRVLKSASSTKINGDKSPHPKFNSVITTEEDSPIEEPEDQSHIDPVILSSAIRDRLSNDSTPKPPSPPSPRHSSEERRLGYNPDNGSSNNTEDLKQSNPRLLFWVRFVAYAIPALFLLYVLYMNFLPFGYNKTFTIDVGSDSDTSGQFYLEPSENLSERKTSESGDSYRELNGLAKAIFNPKANLEGAEITIEVEGEKAFIIPPYFNFDLSTVEWDHSWDLTHIVPQELEGNAFVFDGEVSFAGESKLELPDSEDLFESGPFSIYVEWTPNDSTSNSQQIIGHYNWEFWQNKSNVEFRIGRMDDSSGPFYNIKYPVDKEFFGLKHSAVAIYNPSKNGYIDLFVDGNFAGRTHFETSKLWKNYGDHNLSLGKSGHGSSTYFNGFLYNVNIASRNILPKLSTVGPIPLHISSTNISIVSNSTTTLSKIKINVVD